MTVTLVECSDGKLTSVGCSDGKLFFVGCASSLLVAVYTFKKSRNIYRNLNLHFWFIDPNGTFIYDSYTSPSARYSTLVNTTVPNLLLKNTLVSSARITKFNPHVVMNYFHCIKCNLLFFLFFSFMWVDRVFSFISISKRSWLCTSSICVLSELIVFDLFIHNSMRRLFLNLFWNDHFSNCSSSELNTCA